MTRRALLTHAWLQLLLWGGLALVGNHLSSAVYARLDLTDDQRFTLAPPSVIVSSRLTRPVTVDLYFTEELDPPYHDHARAVRTLLEELRAHSGGRILVRVHDPSEDPDAVESARRAGVQPVTYLYQDATRAEHKLVWMGAALSSGTRQVVVGPLDNLQVAEYQLVRALDGLSDDEEDRRVLGWATGAGMPDVATFPSDNPLGALRDQLALRHGLRRVPLGGEGGVPEDVDALIVVGPQLPLSPRALYQLDQVLLRGTPVAFFLSGIRPSASGGIEAVDHGVQPLLARAGLDLPALALLDRSFNDRLDLPLTVGGQRQIVRVNHPLVPRTDVFDPTLPPLSGLDALVLPFATPIELQQPLPAGLSARVWVHTRDTATAAPPPPSLHPTALATPGTDERAGPFAVVVEVSGPLRSAFSELPTPLPEGWPAGSAVPPSEPDRIEESARARLLAVSSADAIANNPQFVLGALEWLVEDPDLLSIRSRIAPAPRLEALEPSERRRWRWLAALPPLLLLLPLGVYGLRRRRRG